MIRSQAAKKKETGDEAPKGTGSSNPSTKRKQLPKGDRPTKKPKVPLEPVVRLMAEGAKTVTLVKHGAGKGPMKAPSINQEKPPVLLRKDSKYDLEQLSSIMSSEDYEDLGNHSTEAMGETGLFCSRPSNPTHHLYVRPFQFAFNLTHIFLVFQAMVIMKGLMGRCLTHETALERVRAKAEQMEEELNQLHSWKSTMEKKFELWKRVRKDLEQSIEEAKKTLKGKDKEIKDLKDRLR